MPGEGGRAIRRQDGYCNLSLGALLLVEGGMVGGELRLTMWPKHTSCTLHALVIGGPGLRLTKLKPAILHTTCLCNL